jgi:hypothetical protein
VDQVLIELLLTIARQTGQGLGVAGERTKAINILNYYSNELINLHIKHLVDKQQIKPIESQKNKDKYKVSHEEIIRLEIQEPSPPAAPQSPSPTTA